MSIPAPQPVLQAAQETGKIGPLRTVKGMQFVHGNVLERLRFVILPQKRILRAHQQVIQHFVVGHQYVRCIVQHGFAVGDDPVFAHHAGGCLSPSADIHAHRHIAAQLGASMNQLRNSFGLIRCKRIHRIDNQRFNAALPTMLPTVFKNRIKEALGLPGAGPCRNQGRASVSTAQPFKGFLLMHIGQICRVNRLKAGRHCIGYAKGQTYRDIRLMVNRALLLQQILKRPFERLVGHGERGLDVIPDALFQLLGQYGWQHTRILLKSCAVL